MAVHHYHYSRFCTHFLVAETSAVASVALTWRAGLEAWDLIANKAFIRLDGHLGIGVESDHS